MGIKQLSKLIKENCKRAVVPRRIGYYESYKIAIDASLSIYQFLIAVRSDGETLGYGDSTTSHIIGMFYRTIRMIEQGIIPVYVFDGKAPAMKAAELQKRKDKRDKAQKLLEEAVEEENKEEKEKNEKRKVKVDETHVNDCKKLLKLMGIPFITAESEAEAYCSFLCKKGSVRYVATEDMDALCFGAPVLLRNMNAAQSKKLDIDEYHLDTILKELELTMDSFIDLCILLGCDYCETIKGIGYKRALELIKQHGNIEKILELGKFEAPENFQFEEARCIFKNLSSIGDTHDFQIKYDQINQEELKRFLVEEKGFDENRVKSGIEKIMKGKSKGNQSKLDSFFVKKQTLS